mgnify:CR=1 FL=1
MDFLTSPEFWLALGQIIIIDILLGGDNAVVIALACRKLPPAQRAKGIIWGTAGAIVLRVVLIAFAMTLLSLPFLKFVGALLLVWIGMKLIAPEEEEALKADSRYTLTGLRALALEGRILPAELGAIAQGKAMLHWHATHRFCAKCGQPSHVAEAGWKRVCDACKAEHFPRTDPVVIMLTVDGERCLLGRSSRFPPGWYSTLAGFVEPGETIEDAVRRETFEEAGIVGGRVTIMANQPWPFPASLMIGAYVEAKSTAIAIDHEELEDCRWFSRDEVRQMLSGTHSEGLGVPAKMSIASHLIRHFVGEG